MNRKTRLIPFLIVIIMAILSAGIFAMQSIKSPQLSRLIRVACVGDSITSDFGYPETLQVLLGENYVVSNFGVAGATVGLDFETAYMRDSVFTQAKESQPDIVIIMLGTNDARFELEQESGNFINDYKKLIDALQESLQTKIWVVKPPPIFNEELGLSPEFLRQNIIPNIEDVAANNGLPVIDVYSALRLNSNYFYDGVHPTVEGSKLIANTIYQALI